MTSRLKTFVRDALPRAAQVPLKFHLDRVRGYHEPEMALLPYLVRSGDHVIDVGGNRGAYAYRLAQLGAVVEVFEPNPACFSVLQAWASGRGTIKIHPVGLSDHDGTIQLRIPVDEQGIEHDASASMEPHVFAHAREQVVELRRLDGFNFRDVAFIKIDVEGHEYSTLLGGMHVLARCHPALLIEIEQRHLQRPIQSVFQLLFEAGYVAWFLDAGVLKAIQSFDLARDQCVDEFNTRGARYINNFLFLHAQKVADGAYKELLSTYGAT